MTRAIIFFSLAALLTILTFYSKSEHSLDLYLAIPVGLYFITALLLVWRPKASWSSILQFGGSAILIWLVLYAASYNLLFIFIVPVAGGTGAWLLILLAKKLLELEVANQRAIILTGVLTAVLGLLFMIAMRALPKETFTIGLKAGVISAFWQIGVGLQLVRRVIQNPKENTDFS